MKEACYVPNMNVVLCDVEDEKKEHILCHHSEKMAIAFGIFNIPLEYLLGFSRTVCDECHSAIKFISTIVTREFIVRDTNRFHHFKGRTMFVWVLLGMLGEIGDNTCFCE
jgi:hypothetical protein